MYEVQYAADHGNGYRYKRGFKTFDEAKAWALEYIAPSWWTIARYYE